MLHDTLANIAECQRMLDEARVEFDRANNAFVSAKQLYLTKYRRAVVNAAGSDAAKRRAVAEIEAEELEFLMDLEEIKLVAVKERQKVLYAQLSALQTVARIEQNQFMAEPTGQWT